jgi:hypothetical protein
MAWTMTTTGGYERFRKEDGAVTVDWVVLTAAIVAMGMIAGTIIWNNSGSVARNVSTYLGSQSVQTTF